MISNIEDFNNIKKIGVVSILDKNDLVLIDCTPPELRSYKSYGLFMYGAVGAAIESVMNDIRYSKSSKKALGGNPDELQLALKNYPINDVFMENIFGLFKLNLDPNIKQKISLVPIVSDIAISDENKEDKKFDKIANENGLDAILKINYMYGLATFERSPPKAIINAKAKLFRILDKKTIYQNSFLVYDKRAFGKHVARFAENQARLYKIDLIQEIKGLAIILAYDLRI
jgi:hypothetical protein